MDARGATLQILDDLVAFPTVTADSNLDLIAYATARLDGVGAEVRTTYNEQENKANVFATIGPPVDGGVVLSGHTDVVPADGAGWSSDPFAPERRGDLLYGRGVVDMKGGIAAFVAACAEIADHPGTISLIITGDEEGPATYGTPKLMEWMAERGRRQ